jgi:hypothetical protein
MDKIAITLFFGTGVLLGFSRIFTSDELTPIYIGALLIVVLPVAFAYSGIRRKNEAEARALDVLREAQRLAVARREAKSKIPRGNPRRESDAARVGAAKLGAARSMAVLIRKPPLRSRVLEICDFADLVLETIRRMPDDTPAATTFSETHLTHLTGALEQIFKMSRVEEYNQNHPAIDASEIECFSAFITLFRTQQENILTEGHVKPTRP